jgi:hypothetical protein
VIRQAISCDICASEKKQTNHWFVAYEQAGELRLSGWGSRNRLRAGAKHLCGQTCLHKLIDEFMAKEAVGRNAQNAAAAAEAEVESPRPFVEYDKSENFRLEIREKNPPIEVDLDLEYESSARLIPAASAARAIPAAVASSGIAKTAVLRAPVEIVSPAARIHGESPAEEAPRFSSRNWRAEAWEREREREQHALPRHSGIAARRRSNG